MQNVEGNTQNKRAFETGNAALTRIIAPDSQRSDIFHILVIFFVVFVTRQEQANNRNGKMPHFYHQTQLNCVRQSDESSKQTQYGNECSTKMTCSHIFSNWRCSLLRNKRNSSSLSDEISIIFFTLFNIHD